MIIWDPQRDSGQRTQGATRPTSEAEARAATEAFYRTYLQIRAMGIPNATQRGRLRAHLSPALEAALVGAAQAEQAHRAASGPAEPPLHEGDLFSAAQEGARTAVVQGCEMAGDRAVCTVQLGRDEGGSRLEWQDMLTLARTPLGWRLDDVAYGPQGAVGNFGTLRALLTVLVRQTDPRPPPPGATPPEGAPQRGSPQGALMPPPVDTIATSAVRDEAVTIFGIPIPGFVR